MGRKIFLFFIKVYQKVFSFDQGFVGKIVPIKLCRFEPTCSQYAYEAIAKYGVFTGGVKGCKRILRCHPWSRGGFDPVD